MITIPEQEIKVIESKSTDVLTRANSITVENQADYNACADFLKAVKGLKKEIDDTFKDPIKKAHEAHKALLGAKKKHYQPLDDAERIVKKKSIDWWSEQKRIEREEQRKREEEARRAEEKRKAELEAQAKKWEEKGKAEKAEERRQQAEEVHVQTPVSENRVEKSEGQAIKTVWKAEVTDLFALCNAIAKGDLPETVVSPNMKELNALARTWKNRKGFDGVKFYEEKQMSVRV